VTSVSRKTQRERRCTMSINEIRSKGPRSSVIPNSILCGFKFWRNCINARELRIRHLTRAKYFKHFQTAYHHNSIQSSAPGDRHQLVIFRSTSNIGCKWVITNWNNQSGNLPCWQGRVLTLKRAVVGATAGLATALLRSTCILLLSVSQPSRLR
jgi:hypothetical protein